MSQYRSRLSATELERCVCVCVCVCVCSSVQRRSGNLEDFYKHFERFFGLLFYSFSNSQPPSARCADVLGASFHHFRPSAPETSWLLFIQHPYTVNTTLHIFSSAPNVRQRDQISSAHIHSNWCWEWSPGQSLDYLSVLLCDSVHEWYREERGRKECTGNETEKVSGHTSVCPGCVFSQERPGGHSVSGKRPTCTNYSTQTRLLGETDLALPPLTTYQPESWRGERSLVITS